MMSDLTTRLDYVADELPEGFSPPERRLSIQADAELALTGYMRARASAVLNSHSGPPTVLLSGGIDSISVVAALCSLGVEPLCVTVIASDGVDTDLERAAEITQTFGLEHVVLDLGSPDLIEAARRVISQLNTTEMWEISAAIPISESFRWLVDNDWLEGPVFTGGGGDVILAGGRTLSHPIESDDARRELERVIWEDLLSHFTFDRQIPDFYQRLLGDQENRLTMFFQTRQAWDVTSRFGPELLFSFHLGDQTLFDKAILRQVAVKLGVPEHLAWTPKEPMQVSSGVVSGLEQVARETARQFPNATVYSDPLTEPAGHVLARWFLQSLAP